VPPAVNCKRNVFCRGICIILTNGKINIDYFPKHDKQAGLSNEEVCVLWGRNWGLGAFVTLRKAKISSSDFTQRRMAVFIDPGQLSIPSSGVKQSEKKVVPKHR